MNGKSVQELRKQLTQEIQINSVRQIGTCQAPSKVIRMLNKATLINILTDGFIDWNTLDNNDGIVHSTKADQEQENNDSSNDTKSESKGKSKGDSFKPYAIPVDDSRQYVTTQGVVPPKQIAQDLKLEEFSKSIGKAFTLLDNKVKNIDTNGGGGEVVIKINDKEVKRMEGEHYHPKFNTICNYAKWHKNVFLVGEAGTGKTTIASQVANAFDLDFAHLSCSAGMSEAHLLGRMLFDGSYVESDFVKIYEGGGVFLLDEFDAMDGNTAVVINSALANGSLSVPNRKDKPTATRHDDCIIIASANTWGNGYGSNQYAGRNRLDGATLDRFTASKIHFTYDVKLERKLAGGNTDLINTLNKLRKGVKDYSLNRIVSTRLFKAGNIALTNGETLKEFVKTITIDWTDEEKAKVDVKNITGGSND